MPAIWLYQRDDVDKARQLFNEYQQERALNQRALYRQLKAQGEYQGFFRHNLNKPIRFLGYSLLIVLIFLRLFEMVVRAGPRPLNRR